LRFAYSVSAVLAAGLETKKALTASVTASSTQ